MHSPFKATLRRLPAVSKESHMRSRTWVELAEPAVVHWAILPQVHEVTSIALWINFQTV